MDKVASIAKNTSYFTFALILQKIVSFAYFAVLANFLIPEELGKYFFAISFTTIFSVFIDLGLANVLIRETAKAKERTQELLGTVLAIKLPLAGLTALALVILINILGYPVLTRQLVYLSSLSMLLDSFTLIFFAVIRGHHNLFYESIASFIFQFIILALGLSFLKAGRGLIFLMLALVSASIFNFIFSFCLVRFKWKIPVHPVFNRVLIKSLILFSIPFGLYSILQRLFMYLDTVLLSMLSGDHYVGLYQVSFKIIFALQFLPMAFTASLYPAFASYWKKMNSHHENNDNKPKQNDVIDETPSNLETVNCAYCLDAKSDYPSQKKLIPQLVITFERAMNYLVIISLPISFGVICLADKIMLVFKPEYMTAVLPLQIIMASLLFIFVNFPIGSLLNACDRQKTNTANMAITLFVSILLNLWLITYFQSNYANGAIGASITVILANMLMFFLGIFHVPGIIKIRPKKIIYPFIKALASASIMAIFVIASKSFLNIFLLIPIAGVLYFSALLIFGGIQKEDIKSIYSSFIKKRNN